MWFVIFAAALAMLVEDVGDGEFFHWDPSLFSSLGELRDVRVFEGSLALFSLLGGGTGGVLLAAIATGWLGARGRFGEAVYVGASLLGANAIGRGLKDTLDRPRPGGEVFNFGAASRWILLILAVVLIVAAWRTGRRRIAIASVVAFGIISAIKGILEVAIRTEQRMDSFPSGHAISSMALFASLAVLAWGTRLRWKAAAGGAIFVGLVGLSRVALGFHYTSDVLGGWLVALAWVALLTAVALPRLRTSQTGPSDSLSL